MQHSRKLTILTILILASICSCNKTPRNMIVRITKTATSSLVSSGSGVAVKDEFLYIVGDDACYIGKYSLTNSSKQSQIDLYPNAPKTRISKPLKYDLESTTWGKIGDETYLLAFGSGGISPTRDSLFALNTDKPEGNFRRSLSALYDAIRLRAALKATELNIEGAAIIGNRLVLLNRGNNFLVILPWDEFVAHITHTDEASVPSFTIVPVALPTIDGYPIGFSGACSLNNNQLLFTASLEETTDYIQDGAVKGSYIGILNIDDDKPLLGPLVEVKTDKGQSITDKLESVEVLKINGNNMSAIAVADNDDGTSRLIYLDIVLP